MSYVNLDQDQMSDHIDMMSFSTKKPVQNQILPQPDPASTRREVAASIFNLFHLRLDGLFRA
jgi:hypothetical protein